MTRPDSTNGPAGSPTQQWAWPAAYSGQQYANPGAQPPYQGYQQPYAPSYQPYPPQPHYAGSWNQQPRHPFPPAPIAPAAPRQQGKPSTGKLVALAVAGFLLVGCSGARSC